MGSLGRGITRDYMVFVRRLAEKGAVSPETAVTFEELDIDLGVHCYVPDHIDTMLLVGELARVGKNRFYLKKHENTLKKIKQLLG